MPGMWGAGFTNAFEQAVDWFTDQVPVTDEMFKKMRGKYRRRAFHIAGVNDLEVVTQAWEAVSDALAKGETLADFKTRLGDELQDAWGEDNGYRLDTIFRTNVQSAYNAGRYRQQTDPAVLSLRPYWKFSTVLDTRTSTYCTGCQGVILPASDPWWETHQPPLHFNCRSTLISLTEAQAVQRGISPNGPDVTPQKGFGRAAVYADDYKPDLSSYPAELTSEYEEDNGDQE